MQKLEEKKSGLGSWFKQKVDSVMTIKERFHQIKKPEIVEPYLNSMDSMWLNQDVLKSFQKEYEKDPESQEKFRRIMKPHFINDIFGLFYNENKDMKLAKRTDMNEFRYKLLEKVNRSGIKIVSNRSTFNSTIFTQEIAKYFYELYKNLTPEQMKELERQMSGKGGEDDEEGGQNGKGTCQGSGGDGEESKKKGKSASKRAGSGTTNTPVQELQNMLNSSESEKQLEAAIKKAQDKIDLADKAGIKTDEQNAREAIGKIDLLERHKSEIQQMNISKEALLKAVKKILDRSTSYFSSRYKVDEVSIFDAENMNDLEGIEYLHPAFRRGFIPEMICRDKRYMGRYDLFVDNSGSMGSSAGLPDHKNVSCMLLAKAIGLRMKRMDLLNDLYEFQGSVTKVESTELSLYNMCARGGTVIDGCIRQCKISGNNSVILTDACDTVNEYLPNILFLGVNGVNWEEFRQTEVGRKYIENGQCCYFQGTDCVFATL